MDLTHLPLSGPPSTTPSEFQSWLRRHLCTLTIARYFSQKLVAPCGVGQVSCHRTSQTK